MNENSLLTGSHWQFGNTDRMVAPFLTLTADGGVQGHDHPNERRWVLDGDALCFFKDDGTLTSRLVPDENGGFFGRSLVVPTVSLVLTPIDWGERQRPGSLTRKLFAENI